MTEVRRVPIYKYENDSRTDLSLSSGSLTDVPMNIIRSMDTEKQTAPQASADEQHGKLVDLKQGIITIISLMIGSGIFASAGSIHREVGSIGVAFAVWLITGCMALCGALCYAELGTAIPGSGGEMQYLDRGLGGWAAFVFEWTAIMLLRPASISILMEAFSRHAMMAYIAASGIPWISSATELTEKYKWHCRGIAIIGCLLITLSASISTRASDRIQGVLTYGKVASLIAIIGAGLGYAIFKDSSILRANFMNPLQASASKTWLEFAGGLAIAMNHGLWAFDGWNNLNIISGRVLNPARTLPLSIWTSILVVMFLYTLVLLGYYSVVPAEIVMKSGTVGVEFGRQLASATGAVIMSSFVVASTLGAALSSLTTSSEIIMGSAKKGNLPRIFGSVASRTGTTIWAYVMQCALAILILFLPGYDALMTICTFPTWIFYTACVIVLLLLRKREPLLERPYRVLPTTPVIFLIACITLMATSAYEDKYLVGLAFLVVLLGIPVYWLVSRRRMSKN